MHFLRHQNFETFELTKNVKNQSTSWFVIELLKNDNLIKVFI